MCMSRRHVDYLDEANERHHLEGRVGYETYERFSELAARCRACDRCDNGLHGDILEECRVSFLRYFVSMKRDAELRLKKARELEETPGPRRPLPVRDSGAR